MTTKGRVAYSVFYVEFIVGAGGQGFGTLMEEEE